MSYRYGGKARPGSQVSGWLPSGQFTPALLNPEIWLDAADTGTITSSGSPARVSQWNDNSLNARHVVQATALSQPTTGATTQNGYNVIDFVSSRFLRASAVADWTFMHDGTCVYAIYVAYKRTAGTGQALVGTSNFNNGGIGAMHMFSGSGTGFYQYVFGAAVSIIDDRAVILGRGSEANIVGGIYDPGNATAAQRASRRINGVPIATTNTQTGAASSNNAQSALNIGFSLTGAAWTGSIFEVVIWKSPTTEQCQLLESYLNKKWACY